MGSTTCAPHVSGLFPATDQHSCGLGQKNPGNSDLHGILQVEDSNEARQMNVETQSLEARRENELADSRRNAYYPDVDSGTMEADCDGGDRGVEVGERVGVRGGRGERRQAF